MKDHLDELWRRPFALRPGARGTRILRALGTGHLGTLFGVCFFSHQAGSFLCAWLGDFVFDLTEFYAVVWILTAASGAMAALLHFPIKDAASVPLAARA